MTDGSDVLNILKWASLALGAASAVWGLLAQKPTVEDEHGRKRLTPSGMVTLAMMLGSALIGAGSFGLETLAKQQEMEAAARKDQAGRLASALEKQSAAEEQRVRDARDVATQADVRVNLAESRQRSAEQRATDAEQRATSIALAAEARMRDLELGRQVGLGASRNLERTGEALTQIERVIQPLEPLTVRITWEIPPDAPGVAAATRRMAASIRASDAAALAEWRAVEGRHTLEPLPAEIGAFLPGDEGYPDQNHPDERVIFANVRSPRSRLAFFDGTTPEAVAITRLCGATRGMEEVGDLRLEISGKDHPTIYYVVATGAVRFEVESTISLDQMGRTGAIVSIPDLQRGLPFLDVNVRGEAPDLRPLMRPVAMWIGCTTRTYPISIEQVRRVATCGFRPIFSLPRLAAAKPK